MKKWIIFFVFLSCINNLYSQTWERAFGYIPAKEEGATTICKLSDGNFVASGYSEETNAWTARMLKITPYGDTLWSKSFSVPNSERAFINASLSLNYGSFLVAGECQISTNNSGGLIPTGFVAKFDSNNNLQWIREYSTNNVVSRIFEIIVANDGGFICVGNDYILKINNDGIYQWHKLNSGFGVKSIYSIKAFNNGYLSLANTFPNSTFYLLLTNNYGNKIWMKQIPTLGMLPSKLFPTQEKILIFGGFQDTGTHHRNIVLHTFDTSGNFIISKRVNVQREENSDGFNLQISPNRYLLSSLTPLTGATHYCTLRLLDTNLNIIRYKDLTTTAGFRGLYSAVMQDSNYIVAAGNISLHLGYGYEDFYVVKTDTNLNLLVSIGIKKLETETPDAYSLHQNYPNPFNPFTSIKFTLPEESFVKIEIFDITGRMTDKIVEKKMTAGTYEAVWNGTDKPSGIYFCQMTAGRYTKTIRMVMVK